MSSIQFSSKYRPLSQKNVLTLKYWQNLDHRIRRRGVIAAPTGATVRDRAETTATAAAPTGSLAATSHHSPTGTPTPTSPTGTSPASNPTGIIQPFPRTLVPAANPAALEGVAAAAVSTTRRAVPQLAPGSPNSVLLLTGRSRSASSADPQCRNFIVCCVQFLCVIPYFFCLSIQKLKNS